MNLPLTYCVFVFLTDIPGISSFEQCRSRAPLMHDYPKQSGIKLTHISEPCHIRSRRGRAECSGPGLPSPPGGLTLGE